MPKDSRSQEYNKSQDLQQQECQDNSSLHRYRTEIPNIIFNYKLNSYEFQLYCLYKRVAGDSSACFMTNLHLAEEMGCSVRKLINTKKSLVIRGLITVTKRTDIKNGDLPDLVQIVDIWPQNMQELSKVKKTSGGMHNMHTRGAQKSHKEDPIIRNIDRSTFSEEDEQHDPEQPKAEKLYQSIITKGRELKRTTFNRWIRKYGRSHVIDTYQSIERYLKKNPDSIDNYEKYFQKSIMS